jgi:hypothetical protein
LLVGGYAVGYYGYPRTTADIDVWIERNAENAARIVAALITFGFGTADLEPSIFLDEHRILRMGNAPLRIEIMMAVSGVTFESCYEQRKVDTIDGIDVSLIGLDCLKKNKQASGRHKDMDDLQHLP